jgi:ribonucleoside-triphosphate reductase
VSLNLPRLALDARLDEGRAEELLFDRLGTIVDVYKTKDGITRKLEKLNLPEFYWIDIDGTPLIDLDVQSFTTGHVGLNELIENLYNTNLATKEGHELGLKWMRKISKWSNEASIENQMMINLWEQPAESTAHDFAKYDAKKYGKENINVQYLDSIPNSFYYTNSNHVPYNYPLSLWKRLKYQGEFHPIVKGGVISHVWLDDAWVDRKALSDLIQNTMKHTSNYYWSYTIDKSTCRNCGKHHKYLVENCCGCGSNNLDDVSKITGYYGSMTQANIGKQAEWRQRIKSNVTSIY